MSNLLFLHRSCAYRHAAAAAFRKARALPIGSERNAERVLGRALSDLARTEAWLEGQRPSPSVRESTALANMRPDRSDGHHSRISE
jgi:hypothetical protein